MSLLLARRGVVAGRSSGGGGGGGDPTPIYSAAYSVDGYNGLFNDMGTDDGAAAFENPATSATRVETYTASQSTTNGSLTADLASDQVEATGNEAHTANVPSSYWVADFGADRAVKLTHYGIIGRDPDGLWPRNWKLQGSNNGTTWEDLDVQAANTSVGAGTWFSGAVSSTAWWRYIRINMKGLNSDGGSFANHLVLGDVELWGELGDATGLTLPSPSPLPAGTVADRTWSANGVTDGVFDSLGTDHDTDDFTQPHGKATGDGGYTASAKSELGSSTSSEKATNRFVNSYFHSTNASASQWWMADFGAGRQVTVDHYAMQGRSPTGQHPRNWKLQGSNDGTTWTDLDTQTANTTINSNVWWSGAVVGAAAYRYLRILQTGANSSGEDYLVFGQIEFWGTLTE